MITRNTRTTVAAGAAALVASAVVGYAANARGAENAGGGPAARASEVLERTADGRTIGVLGGTSANPSGRAVPDLVKVVANNGREGYVELRLLSGPAFPSSPEEATKQQQEAPAGRDIPVYARDGKTVIGVFTVEGPGRPGDPGFETYVVCDSDPSGQCLVDDKTSENP